MINFKALITATKPQYRALTVLCIALLGMTSLLFFYNPSIFQRFFGNINPLFAFVSIILLAFILLPFLFFKGGFEIYKKAHLKEIFRFWRLAFLFGCVVILVDSLIVFPADMNVAFPQSILFYPTIGFLVEILFHLLPLSILFFLIVVILKSVVYEKIKIICLFIVSLIEPIYQTTAMVSLQVYPLWAVIYTFIHVFGINLVQMYLFKRYDFISMYSFRLVYYLIWRIAWGYFRLKLLFEQDKHILIIKIVKFSEAVCTTDFNGPPLQY